MKRKDQRWDNVLKSKARLKEIVELTKQVDDLISDNVDLKEKNKDDKDPLYWNEDKGSFVTHKKEMKIVDIYYEDDSEPWDNNIIVMEIEDNSLMLEDGDWYRESGYIRKVYLDNHVDNRRLLRSWDNQKKKQQA
tara:strand:+ start:190 stop:594 length:405 start_codon:yes stop_codon:yes gene_type:complete